MSGNKAQRKKRKQRKRKQPKTRNAQRTTSYSTMTIQEAEHRLGFRFGSLRPKPVEDMLANAKHNLEGLDKDIIINTKEKVYSRIVEYLEVEGYPTEANPDFKEANISDLVYSIISPIIRNLMRMAGRKIHLKREKEIVSIENEIGEMEEYVVVMDRIYVTEEKFVLVVGGMGDSAGEAFKLCLLSLKDMRDNNGGGEVYGFVTTGDTWQMLRNDGTSFQISDNMHVLFGAMGENQEKWVKDYSVLVDCVFVALSNGGV
jgi:hypothetical protein